MSLWPLAFALGAPLALPAAPLPAERTPRDLAGPQEPAGAEARAFAAQLDAERRAWRLRERELEERVAALEADLAAEQALRFEREREWLEFTRILASFEVPLPVPPPAYIAEALAPPPDPAAEEAARAREARLARGRDMRAAFGALFAAEQVFALDVLELGEPHTFEGRGVTGPVVARLVDDRGRLVGALAAERLSLEVSRAARTVTLVLEEGYETRAGERVDFEVQGGRRLRRIVLPATDPAPWIEAFPELIDPASAAAALDDGRHDVPALRHTLDDLLRRTAHASGAGWRLRALGGVLGDSLTDVQLVEYAPNGTVERRVFADRMTIEVRGRTVELALRDGSQERGGRVAPFLDGRYRVVLPRADADMWRAAGLPGLAP